MDGVVSGIWSPVAGKGNKGQWVKVDGQAYFKALAFEAKEHLRWVEGDDDVRKKMVETNRGMEKDIQTFSKNYLMAKVAKGKDKLAKLKKEGRGRKKLVQVDSSPDTPSPEEERRRREEVNAKKEKLAPNPLDEITEGMEKVDIEDPNYVGTPEYGEKLLPSDDMGAKVGGKKKEEEEH
jgi:hypothetical protein